jgi:hypothetical protein
MSTELTALFNGHPITPGSLTGEEVFEDISNTMTQALGETQGDSGVLDKYIEYLGVKADAEHPDDVPSNMVPTTMRDYIQQAFCELLDREYRDLYSDIEDEDEQLDKILRQIDQVSRNF